MGWGDGQTASEAIWAMLDAYRNEMLAGQRSEAREADMDAEAVLGEVEQLAHALLQSGDDLTRDGLWAILMRYAERFPVPESRGKLFEWAMERVNYAFAEDAVSFAGAAPERWWQLVQLIDRSNVSNRVKRFLRRVSRCFIFGMHPECAVMCRATLDAAFQAEISNDLCAEHLGSRQPLSFDFADRIAVAQKVERISYETAQKARTVKEKGNDVVHRDVRAVDDSFPLIKDTIAVLRELKESQGRSAQ